MSGHDDPAAVGLRLDKWLWHARFCKSRTLATRLVAAGRIRVSGSIARKAHQTVRPGDVLTFPLGAHIRVIRVCRVSERRGPASEARTLYEDLDPPGAAPRPEPPAERVPGAGRPTKRDRRAIGRLTGAAD